MTREYTPTIGLEVHAELRTETKMFCSSKNDVDEKRPNANICPVCMGYPGTLPVINHQAVRHVLAFGVAVGGKLADYTEFDRKNYFYPDIPKGYQISQHLYPLVTGGELAGIALTRVHLEEDTARSTHDTGDRSLLDFNRAGIPLMELVTEPVIHDAVTARKFAQELQLLLIYLGASFANMEKGEMRVEANISVSKDSTLGTKVEVKNLNSFKAVEKAILFEIERQIDLLEKGERVVQETRGWDERGETTFSQRAKEDSHDYRYFPDPDLPKLVISEIPEFAPEALKKGLPELPSERRSRLKKTYGLRDEDGEMYVSRPDLGQYFESVMKIVNDQSLAQLSSNYLISDVLSFVDSSQNKKLESLLSQDQFAKVVKLISIGTLSSRGAKDILKILIEEGGEVETIIREKNLAQTSDTETLEKIIKEIIEAHSEVVKEYTNGKVSSLQFLIGQAMKATKGGGNPIIIKSIFENLLN
jgi:aspartyl-tRNA(Asn)/glutamyl-tRNA(Gln) amidotransferase subunit B